ncbi:MAG TPA: PilZ domain-containing protein [Candidatus Acidoferrales bacterium]
MAERVGRSGYFAPSRFAGRYQGCFFKHHAAHLCGQPKLSLTLWAHVHERSAIGSGLHGYRLGVPGKPKSVPKLAPMPWFAKRKSAGPSEWHLFRWPLGHAAPEKPIARDLRNRRAHRVGLNAPVFLYGSLKDEPFSEYSETIDVSIHGALVVVHTHLFPAQKILLTNLQTEQDLKCRVVRVDKNRNAAALEFLEPCPHFWRIDFAHAPTRG